MKKKKILFVVNNFNIGGPQKSLLSLLYNLDFANYDVDIISLNNTGTLLKHIPKEVKILNTEPIISYSLLDPKNIMKKSMKFLFSKKYKYSLLALITIFEGLRSKNMVQKKQKYWLKIKSDLPKIRKEYDYAFGVSGGHSMMFIADCVNAHKKVGWIRSDYRILKRDNEIDRIYFQKMDNILSVSEMCKEIFLEIFPENIHKTEVFYNMLPFRMYDNIPADISEMDTSEETLKLLTICRLDPHKGLDLALDALEKLLENNIKVKWFILGEGNYRRELENIISKRNLKEHFILLGFQLNTAEFMKQADIIVHPSRFEGKSNVVDEAKYLLKPIVVTKYNTVAEQIIHEKTGMIAEMNSVSLSENIIEVKESLELRSRLSSNLKAEQIDDSMSLTKFSKLTSK